MAPIPVPDGGRSAPTVITPEELAHAGQRFADGQDRLNTAATTLWEALVGLSGMAGGDEVGEKFAARYDPAVTSLLAVLQSGIAAFGGISRGLVVTGRNYATAEHHSTARGGVPLPDFADPLVVDEVVFGVPDTAAGGHVSGVNRFLAKYWPQGDDGKLDQAAAAFEAAQRSLTSLGEDAQACVNGLLASNMSPALTDFSGVWTKVWAYGGGSMGQATDACGSLASACRQFASSIRSAHHKLEAIAAAVGVVTTAGVLLTVFTVGLSDAGAAALDAEIAGDAAVVASEFAVEVSAEVEAAIEAELVPMLEAAAADLPEIEVVEAELEQTVTEIEEEVKVPVRSGGGSDEPPGGGNKPPTGGGPPEDPPPGEDPPGEDPADPRINDKQVEKKFKHAKDFGVEEGRGRAGFDAFKAAIKRFMDDPANTTVRGTYRGDPAIIVYDADTGLVVVEDSAGNFVSGWRMTAEQLRNVMENGSLGGG